MGSAAQQPGRKGEPDLFGDFGPPPAQAAAAPPRETRRTKRAPAAAAGKPPKLPAGTIVIEVVLERAAPGAFSYLAGPELAASLTPGARVLAPFGRRTASGYVLRLVGPGEPLAVPLSRLKHVIRRLDVEQDAAPGGAPFVSPQLLALAHWIARQYACPLGPVLAAILPPGVKHGVAAARTRVVALPARPHDVQPVAQALAAKAPRQAALLHALLAAAGPLLAPELLAEAGADAAALKALEKRGLVAITERPALSLGQAYAQGAPAESSQELQLTDAQAQALDAINAALDAGAHQAFLLQGVTGSGKTEVYLRALARALAHGRQGMVLVPEIALTPQTAERFEARLSRYGVAVLHSHLTEGERAEAWHAARAGRIGVAIGARSALFAPLPNLGCIVVDEEHEGTYKQESAPRYHAREVALERARACGAVLVLGSATPSLEAAHAARLGACRRLVLPERVRGAQLPPVEVVSMQDENRETQRYNYLSRALHAALGRTLDRREQAILFLNRRGYATVVTCLRCGSTARCARCDITLTSHRSRNVLVCHYCGAEEPVHAECRACGAPGVKFWGLGTQRVEDHVRALFPAARVARVDSDTMKERGAYLQALSAFRTGQLDILVGTQMIAKGLDFPNVTLVGVILADTALHMPDFRSRERTYQLLEQVAGRAGRGEKGGTVIVQSYLPQDPAIQAAAQHDYDGFAEAELRVRREYGYPPFTRLARVLVRGPKPDKAQAAAQAAAEALRSETRGTPLEVLGPSPAPISMLEGQHRFHVLVKAPDGEALAALFAGPAGRALLKLRGAQAVVDIDPQRML